MIRVVTLKDLETGEPHYRFIHTVAFMHWPPLGTWHIAAAQIMDEKTGDQICMFGGGA